MGPVGENERLPGLVQAVQVSNATSRGLILALPSLFTDEAITFAKANGVNLLDVKALLSLIASRTEDQQQALLNVALEGDYSRPTCVNCGLKMVERSPRKGGAPFWGCKGYPKFKTTLPMRAAA